MLLTITERSLTLLSPSIYSSYVTSHFSLNPPFFLFFPLFNSFVICHTASPSTYDCVHETSNSISYRTFSSLYLPNQAIHFSTSFCNQPIRPSSAPTVVFPISRDRDPSPVNFFAACNDLGLYCSPHLFSRSGPNFGQFAPQITLSPWLNIVNV